MEKIKDYTVYNEGMRKSIRDKLFWEGLVDEKVQAVCDFGCADGELLKQVQIDFPNWELYGIDNDSHMRELAEKKIPDANICISFDEYIPTDNCILNISSVIHEIYSYCSGEQIDNFWENVFDSRFRYIAIRDFMISKSINRPADVNDYMKILVYDAPQSGVPDTISDFENVWGTLQDNKNLVHYLMKYRYLKNWSREVRENYFPITIEEFMAKIPPLSYEIVYFNHYVLPYNREKIRNDFGIELKDPTHVKMLLKKREIN